MTGTNSLISNFKIYKELNSSYDKIRFFEPLIAKDIVALSDELNTELVELENSVKTAKSIEEHLNIERYYFNNTIFDAKKSLKRLKDIIRFTQVCDNANIVKITKQTIEKLEGKDYKLLNIENYFDKPITDTGYVGIHLNFISPFGQIMEVQIHTKARQEPLRNSRHRQGCRVPCRILSKYASNAQLCHQTNQKQCCQ